MKTLCTLRDIYRSIRDFEEFFQQKHDLCLNEGMLLCSLKSDKLSSTELAEMLGLTTSNTSKVIKSVENKGFIDRILGKDDKRQMYFVLTESGKSKLKVIKKEEVEITKLLEKIEAVTKIEEMAR
ncbi:MAG: winged helix DNA-binding protein [Dysgonomonas sp.]